MNLIDKDDDAEQACFITIDWLSLANKEIDVLFGKGYAKRNPLLLGDFIQAAARKYHASVLDQNSVLERIAISIDDLGSFFSSLDETRMYLKGINDQLCYMTDSLDDLARRVDSSDEKTPLEVKFILTALSLEECLVVLKERWLHNNPQYSEKEYLVAINEFEQLLGL